MKIIAWSLSLFVSLVCVGRVPVQAREITFDERVAAQRAIEQVYWSHRIWPNDNPGAKPPLSTTMPEAILRATVDDYLKKSTALETYWRQRIAAEQLQAEMERMARDSRDPRMLKELFDALGNDPFLISEVLVRPSIVDGLIRSAYANDKTLHAARRHEAEAALAICGRSESTETCGAEAYEGKWNLQAEGAEETHDFGINEIPLDPIAWRKQLNHLERLLGGDASSLSSRGMSSLQEDAEGFFVTAVKSQSERELTTSTLIWRKVPFDTWWAEHKMAVRSDVVASTFPYRLPGFALGACSSDTWTPTSTGANVPPARGPYDQEPAHVAVWTGTEMIIWGGYNGAPVGTGGRYRPSTDTWLATSSGTNALSPRYHHKAVWTGSEMLVWGGTASSVLLTGARYNPAADAWISIANGLGPRTRHTAIWTGTEMIIWGGADGVSTSHVNTGGRYSLLTNTWAATSTGANVPVGRHFHTAVWTGTEMIVWGGTGFPAALYSNDGGRYNPSSNSWLPTSTGANVPSVRYSHVAVWTGSTMIVWGGIDSNNQLSTGGRYDPSSDTWTATSTGAGLPTQRYGHSAVWTGAEMIVWGGNGGPGFNNLNSGGRYNPAANTWNATSIGANVPSARYAHSAVWTGTEMIVWGGGGPPLNSGGLYCGCPFGVLVYRDADADGFGNPAIARASCDGSIPPGYVTDSGDCNDSNGAIHGTLPTESGNGVLVARSGLTAQITWNLAAGATSSDVLRGLVGSLPVGPGGADESCLGTNLAGTTLADADVPAAKAVFWYLVRGRNQCGTGTYGTQRRTDAPPERRSTTCP